MEIQDEIWKPIEGFEGFYEISNKGNIKSLNRVVKRGNQTMVVKGRVLHQYPNGNGYMRVQLYKDKRERKKSFIHRLVAKAFVPNPHGYDVVNHLDNNPQNNNATNLEWTTLQGNMEYARLQGRMACSEERRQKIIIANKGKYKPVIGENIKTGEKIYFDHLNKVKEYGFSPGEVCNCCKGKRYSTRGYKFKYAEHNN